MNTCGHQIPNEATFCPFCGAPNQPPVKVNASGLEALISAADVEVDELDMEIPTRRMWPIVAAMVFVALLGVGFFTMFDSAPTAPPAVEEVAELVEPVQVEESAPTVVFNPERLATAMDAKHAEVRYGGQTIFRIEGAKGSRYESVEERSEAFKLRVSHAFTTDSAPKFTAQMVDGSYQVVWKRPDTNFLITDITAEDVKSWEKTNGKSSPAILANLVADRLNMMLELGNDIPNS